MFKKIDSKGQAFSVFELMIAAIVAIAILAVLLQILGGAGVDPTSEAKSAISNSLSTVGNSGSTVSQTFTLADGVIVTSQDFAEDGLDPQSVFFALNDNLSDAVKNNFQIETVDADGKYSILTYKGKTNFRASARVSCAATGTSLDGTLGALDIEYDVLNGEDDTGEEYCGDDIQPCCIVIVQRG